MRSVVGVELNFATQSEIAAARAKANEAFKSWRETPVHERLRVLHSFSQHLRQHETELINLLVEDVAKPVRYARGEVDRAIALIAALDQQIILEQDQLPEATGCRRVPLGVIALIAPF
ncbi:MAG: aldehyde dehydrogenase family protein, partial [Chthoniobacterales bacterium]